MIVLFVPGGTIKNLRVGLLPGEKLPNKFNTPEAEVYRQSVEWPRKLVLIKPVGQVLPPDSDILSTPEDPEPRILDLTLPSQGDITYSHADIIQMDEGEDTEAGGDSN